MYVWIWRHLPGPVAGKLAQVLLLLAAVSRRCCCSSSSRGSSRTCRSARSRCRSDEPRRHSDPRRRQLRQLRLQPRPVPRAAGRRGRRAAQRRRDARRAGRPRRGGGARLARSRRAAGRRPVDGFRARLRRPRDFRCSGCASAIRRSVRSSARRSFGRRNCCTARRARCTTTESVCSPACRRRSPPRATTRSPSTSPDCAGEIEVTGRTASGIVMALRHRTCRSRVCSSIPSRCSPRADTASSPTGCASCGAEVDEDLVGG